MHEDGLVPLHGAQERKIGGASEPADYRIDLVLGSKLGRDSS
jgi:hypothetical protein